MKKFLFGIGIGVMSITGITFSQSLNNPSNPIDWIRSGTKLNVKNSSVTEVCLSDGTTCFSTGGMSNPMSALGDIITGGVSGAATRLEGNTTATPKALMSTGNGSSATAPAWTEITQSIVNGLKATDSPSFTAIELSHATANTLTANAGVLSIESKIVPTILYKCRSKIDMAAGDDSITIGNINAASIITGVSCSFLGTGTTPATVALKDGAGNAMTHDTVTCATQAAAVTWVAVTANNTLTAGETVMYDTTNTPNPTTDDYVICVSYILN